MSDALNKKRWEKIGFLLKHERNCQKLGQEVFARKMDSRQESISRLEAGARKIDVLELIEYAEVLGFSITEIAWKIESYLSGNRLLPLPKTNIIDKKIRVKVFWCEDKYSASFEEIFPETWAFAAETFSELQKEIEEGLDSHLSGLEAGGVKVPWWLKKRKYEIEYKFLDAMSLLNAYCPHYVSLAAISRVSEINKHLLSQYANGQKNAGPNQLKRIAKAIQIIGKKLTAVAV